jgi:glutathione S-transferase
MYKLYYSPGACSMAVHVLLNDIGAEFSLEKAAIKEGATQKPEFLKLNPRGQVPVLVDGDYVMREGGAILPYLADKHASKLLPREGRARAEALEWLAFANATLHPAYSRAFWINKKVGDLAGPNKDVLIQKAAEWISKLWEEVEQRLAKQQYIAGANMTLADVLLTVIANWTGNIPHPVTIGPKTRALFQRVIALPAYQKALQAEGVEYKEAA